MAKGEDFLNKIFSTPELRARADTAALRTSYIGLGKLVKAQVIDGKVSYVISGTGEVKKTIQEANQRVQEIYLTQVSEILNSDISQKFGSRVGAIAGMVEEIQNAYSGLSIQQKKLLKEIGIDDVSSLDFNVTILGGQKGSKVGEAIADLRKSNVLDGFFLVDDDSGRIITARSGEKMLNNFQLTMLFRMTGHELITEAAFESENFGKIPKRIKTLISEREISVAGKDFDRFLGIATEAQRKERILVVDPQYDLLRKASMEQEGKIFNLGDNRLNAYYKGRYVKNYFGTYLDELEQEGLTREFFDVIKSFKEDANSNFQSDALKKHFEENIKKKPNQTKLKEIFNKIYNEIEYTFDGSDLLNEKFFKKGLKELRTESNRLAKFTDVDSRRRKEEINNIISQIENSKLNQITGRGRVQLISGETLDIKTAFSIFGKDSSSIFEREGLENVAMIISKFAAKKETGFGGPGAKMMLSGFGRGVNEVFSDPVSTAFHPELFADEQMIEAIQNRSQTVLAEYRSVLEEGVVPQRLKRQLKEMSEQATDFVDIGKRVSAQRNRELAEKTLELINMGIDPRQSPKMMNMLHTLYHTQVFTIKEHYKGDRFKLVLPETYRFAVDTEKSLNPDEVRLGKGFEKIGGFQKADGTVVKLDDAVRDILKFRIKNGTIFFGTEAMSRVRESLGGFDLDDKGIARMFKYTDDNGMSRIAFNLTRQPSGIEETMIGRALFDEDTVRELMKGEYFKKAMDALTIDPLATSGPFHPNYQNLLKLQGIAYEDKNISEVFGTLYDTDKPGTYDNIEKTILDVYEQMEKMGFTKVRKLTDKQIDLFGKFGFSTIQGTEPAYTRAGIYKLFTDPKNLDIVQEVHQAAREAKASGLKDNVADKLMAATSMDEIRAIYRGSETAKGIFESAFQLSTLKVGEDLGAGGSLGTYVNRSMIVGSTLNQYEDLLKEGIKDERIKRYLLENFQIGMLSSEGAIDPATQGVTGVKIVREKVEETFRKAKNIGLVSRELITEELGAGLGEKGIQKSLQVLIQTKGTTDDIGLQSIKNLGRQIGAIRVIGNIDTELLLGVDAITLRDRLSKTDAKVFLENIMEGVQTTRSDFQRLGIGINPEIDELYENLQKISNEGPSELLQKVIDIFGLGADSKYSAEARLARIGEQGQSMFDAQRNTYLKKINEDIVRATITSEESDTLAKSIINRNQRMYSEFFTKSISDLKLMTETEKVNLNRMKLAVSADILKQIDEASQLKGISLLDLVNSFAKVRAQTGFDVQKLDIGYIDTEGLNDPQSRQIKRLKEVQKNIDYADSRREVNFYKKMRNNKTDEFMSKYVQGETYSELQEKMADTFGNIQAGMADDLERAIAQVMAGQSEDILDAELRREAQREAGIIQRVMLDEENAKVYEQIEKRGTISTVDEALREFGDDTSINEDIMRSVDELDVYDPVNKATYKRLSQKIKNKEISKLFKDPIVKRGTIAVGALMLGSLVYSAAKDRTMDDMTGPPLLPGGSAYEQQYPTRVPEIGTFNSSGYDPGMSYNVSVNGGYEDMQRFNEAARGFINGSTSTTIYEGLPNMTQDPYRTIASRY
jgi:hypothetical protein